MTTPLRQLAAELVATDYFFCYDARGNGRHDGWTGLRMPTHRATLSSLASRASAGFLFLAGIALLFGSDTLLPRLVPDFPPDSAWLGQVGAAAWLGVANLNWLSRSTLLGGIYGRPVVATNLTLYTISALGSLKALSAGTAPPGLWVVAVPMGLFAILYGGLLLRGPFDALGSER